jgi:Fe-S-cluster containining protein
MSKDGNPDDRAELTELHRQVERAGLFTHTTLTGLAARVNESESFLYGLIDLMVQKGLITAAETAAAVQRIRQELIENDEGVSTGLALRVDAPDDDQYTPVDCQERWPVCKAICCKLDFALNAEEVESGAIKWDMGRPYFIRHERNGLCTHLNGKTKECGVYHDRPGVCKKYSCAEDTRIWKDFDKMELNVEWIDSNLKEFKPRFVETSMFTDQKIVYKSEVEEDAAAPTPKGSDRVRAADKETGTGGDSDAG